MTKLEPISRAIGRHGKMVVEATAPQTLLRRRSFLPVALGLALMVAAPTALAAWYWFAIAADRYVTDFRYSVRSGAALAGAGGDGLLQGSGALVFASDSFILEDYLLSEAAFADVETIIPLRTILGRDGGDPLRGYDAEAPIEELLDHWNAAVRPRFDAVTGITTVTVSLYRPEDALAVAEALVAALDRLVDSLTAEARGEMLAYVNREYAAALTELALARERIEAFRRANRVISPNEEVSIGSSIIGALSSQLAEARVTLRALRSQSPDSPRIPALESETRALEDQLLAEIGRRGGEDGGADALPGQLASFDALQNDYEIARENLVATRALRQQAEAYATLGQAELVVFVRPRAASTDTRPRRWIEVVKIAAVALAVWVILRVFLASLRP